MAPLTQGKTSWQMEYSVHSVPPAFKREIQTVFPKANLEKLLIVPTCQRSDLDLVRTGEKIEDEKDRLLERFMAWAKKVCDHLDAAGQWADYIDPCSGLPMIHTDLNVVYPEVPALSVLMNYQTANAGCCKVLLHPVWGSSVYPASLFTEAPLQALMVAIEQANVEMSE